LQSAVLGTIDLGGPDTGPTPEAGVREVEFQLQLLMR
jgi:hypothetical protein